MATKLAAAAAGGGGGQLVQYIALRGDLLRVAGWPVGALVAQACHACSAVLYQSRDDPATVEYLAHLDRMHKVVLEVGSEEELKQLSVALETGGVVHKLWVEQPEDCPTCLATKPCPKGDVQKHFRKLKLFK